MRTLAATLLEVARLSQPVRACRYRKPQKVLTIKVPCGANVDVASLVELINANGIKAEVAR